MTTIITPTTTRLKLLWNAGSFMSWGWLLLVLPMGLLLVLPSKDAQAGKAITFCTLGFASNCTWWMFGGARLLILLHSANTLALPRGGRDTLISMGTALLITLGIPTVLAGLAHTDTATTALTCLTGAASGLAWVTLPPWLTTVAVSSAPPLIEMIGELGHALPMHVGIRAALMACALMAALTAVWGWRRTTRREWSQASAWMRPPIASMQIQATLSISGALLQQNELQSTLSRLLQGVAAPHIPQRLRERPCAALAVALGPPFAPAPVWATLAAICISYLGPALLSALGQNYTALLALLANILGGMPLLTRVMTLRHYPALGMNDLALLPGLGQPAKLAPSLASVLTRRLLLRTVPYVLLILALQVWRAQPASNYLTTLFMAATCICTLNWQILRNVLKPAGGGLQPGVAVALLILFSWSTATHRPPEHLWMAFGAATLIALGLYAATLRRLCQRPHPWLQN